MSADISLTFQIANPIKLAPDLLPETFTITYFTSVTRKGTYKIRVKDSSCNDIQNWLLQAHLTPPKGRKTVDWYVGCTASGMLIILNRVDHKGKTIKVNEHLDFQFEDIKYRIQRMPNTNNNNCWNATVFINVD